MTFWKKKKEKPPFKWVKVWRRVSEEGYEYEMYDESSPYKYVIVRYLDENGPVYIELITDSGPKLVYSLSPPGMRVGSRCGPELNDEGRRELIIRRLADVYRHQKIPFDVLRIVDGERKWMRME